jgi:two-component system KDP operon response regulator KdpE
MKADKKPILLIIDDEAAVRRFLNLSLQNDFVVEEATTGNEGLQKAAQLSPDLIILDLGLPDQDGIVVLRRLREWSQVPVVVLTVRDAEDEKVQLLDAGADDYLTKPFSVVELKARLRVALRHSRAQPDTSARYQSRRLEMDFTDHTVHLDGQPIKLTVTEYDLLRLLALGGGKVVTQRHLLSEIWGGVDNDKTHYLRIYIAQLRKKLERNPSQPELIQTEPGVGYRLRGDDL